MDTHINEVSPAERELEITATAQELDPRIKDALRAQRKNLNLKGFRKGKAPLSLIKRMVGPAVGQQVAEQFVQEALQKEMEGNDELDVLGRPQMTELDYEMGGDLRAVVRFAVRPPVEIADLSDEEVVKLKHEVTDEEVDEELERLRRSNADLMPTDEPAGETSYVSFDLQELDPDSDAPMVGRRDEEQSLFLDSPQIDENPMLQELRDALIGVQPGDTVRFTFSHDAAHGEHEAGHAHAHRFEVLVHEVKRRELPEVDDAFVEDATDGEFASVDVFRQEIRYRLEQAWEKRAREMMQGELVGRMLELHPLPIPAPLAETFLDSFVEDVKRRNDGELPNDFDERYFRAQNRSEAEQQAHWMLLRDQLLEDEDLTVTDDDRKAFYEEQAAQDPQMTAEQIEQFYGSMPQVRQQVDQQLISRKVFDLLEQRFKVVEKDREAFQAHLEAERETREQAAREAMQAAQPLAAEEEAPASGLVTPSGAPAPVSGSTAAGEPIEEDVAVDPDAREAVEQDKTAVEGVPPSVEELEAVGEDGEASDDGPDYEAMTKDEIYEIAQAVDLSGRSSMTKAELIAALRAHPDA